MALVTVRACTVVVHDLDDVGHSLDVTADTLYELPTLRGHEWVGELGKAWPPSRLRSDSLK
jgi:hypothetical protein